MITTLTLLAASAAPMPSVSDTTIAIDRTPKGYSIYTPVDNAPGKYAIWSLDTAGVPGMGIMKEAEIRAFTGYDDRDATAAGAWYPYALKGMYGDRVRWSKSPGAYMEFEIETEPGQTVGLVNFKTTNGGIGAVTIDGEASLANLLPEKDGWRIVDFYSPSGPTPNLFKNTRSVIPLADSLPGGSHTVRVWFTGQKNPDSSDTRIYVDGAAVYGAEPSDADTVAGDFFVFGTTPLTAGGAWESVFKVGSKFYGTNQHGNESLLGFSVRQASLPLTLDVYETTTDQVFTFEESSEVALDSFGAVCRNHRIYNFTSEGLELKLGTQWLKSIPMTHVYPAMWPILDGPQFSTTAFFHAFDTNAAPRTRFDLAQNDLFFKGGFDAKKTYLYNQQNPRTFTFEVTDLDEHAQNPRFWVWDLGSPAYNKLYFQRQEDRYRSSVGEVWTTTAKFRYYYDSQSIRGGY